MFSNFYTKNLSASQVTAFKKTVSRWDAKLFEGMSNESLKEAFWLSKGVINRGFPIVREMAARILGLRPYDVQMIGGLILYSGMLAEMRTGEGKTLTIAAPAAMHALDGKGVHIVTANTYLAQRDAELMRPLYEALGLTVGALTESMSKEARKEAYKCDILYGTGTDFGFDYLRDNLELYAEDRVQRSLAVAIVDEVDSILIDEARTPMIISGLGADTSDVILKINSMVPSLEPSLDYVVDLKERHASLTESGYDKLEKFLHREGIVAAGVNAFGSENLHLISRVHSAIQAHTLFQLDKDYVVREGKVLLVDTSTGRIMDGRRLSDGLHEALEAKEGVEIQRGSLTRATITFQNYFTKYQVLAGLTGTALTEAEEFQEIYHLKTVVVPTHREVKRTQHDDIVLKTKAAKHSALAARVRDLHAKGQPVLIGFGTIAEAERFSLLLTQQKLPHELLTAKHIGKEAHIIANAGAIGAITIATNMAGRGTDIVLGGELVKQPEGMSPESYAMLKAEWQRNHEKVKELGGLFVLGGERNGIRRVDNQLAGRCARQGDPGEVQFYLSLEDELLMLFADEKARLRIGNLIDTAGGSLSGKLLSSMLVKAQQRYEAQGFSARKDLMKYDGVLSKQRDVLFEFQNTLLSGGALLHVDAIIDKSVSDWMARHMPEDGDVESWDSVELKGLFFNQFGVELPLYAWLYVDNLDVRDIHYKAKELVKEYKESLSLSEELVKQVIMSNIAELWPEHLTMVYNLRESAGFAGAIGKSPVLVFQEQAFEAFKSFTETLDFEIITQLLSVAARERRQQQLAEKAAKDLAFQKVVAVLESRWIGRNEQCPCESGKRFKHCHGVNPL